MDPMDQDQVLLCVREQDIRKRMDNGQKLIEYLSTLEGNLKWDNVDRIIDSLATYWVNTSNFKVALLGLDIISLLVERLQDEFQLHYNSVHNALIDRLGDQKEQVRGASVTLFTNIMDASASPQFIFDRLVSVFSHKIWRVRQGLCNLLIATINRFGARSLSLSKIVPHICKLLSDPHAEVRETALVTLGEIYRHVGEKVRQDIMKRGLPPNRVNQILDCFDDILQSGKMETEENETASVTSSGSFGSAGSTTVNSSSSYMKPPATSYVPNNHRASTATAGRVSHDNKTRLSQSATGRRSALPPRSSTGEAGAVDEDTFLNGMDKDLPSVKFYNSRDFEDIMNKTVTVLSDEKKDWEERSRALKTIRAIIVSGGVEQDSFGQHLRTLEPALRLNAKDLRSQVVRETCLTVGYLSTVLKNRFDRTAEALFPTLFNLVPNSAKIMATSGVTTIRIILRNTHGPRLIPIITGNCTSKSTPVRRRTFGFLDLILQEWTTTTLEKQLPLLIEAVTRGIADADSEARSEARKSWWGLHAHFPAEAERLYNGLTSSQQKMIQGQVTASSSTDSIPRSTSSDSHPSVTKRPPSSSRQSLMPSAQRIPSGKTTPGRSGPSRAIPPKFQRSRSDIDPAAAKRSTLKAMSYSSMARSRPSAYATSNGRTPDRRGRDADRPATSQRSQSAHRFAGSRSNSPNSKMRHYGSRTPTSAYRTSRTATVSSEDGAGRTSTSSNPGYGGAGPPMRVLPKGREGEQVLSDALLGRKTGKRRGESYGYSDNDDDFSDTSSVCSDRSSSYQSSRNGVRRSHNHVHTEDIAEILTLCQSSNWVERKEGLLSLHALIKREKLISRMEMKKILEIFSRMFADPHGKVFSLFLEILPDFVATYKENIEEWLYTLMTQLLKKMGADLLGSVQAKVIKAMQTTRMSFSPKQQFNILTRYIVDQTQTPNLKVKVALLHYLLDLITLMDSSDINSNSEMRLVISRIITWTTEPKSQDVRKAAESVVISLFELNPGEFSMMLRILPKTFQDGAMKVLHFHMKSNGDLKFPMQPPSAPSSGRVTARIGMSPSGHVVSPHGSISGTVDIMSPRGSEIDDIMSDHTGGTDETEENLNFRDITAGIHKLRLDSNVDGSDYKQKDEHGNGNGIGAGDPSFMPQVCYPPPFQQLQNTPKLSANRGINNRYNPGVYSEKITSPPFYNKEALKEAMFDDDDTISDEFSQEEASLLTQLNQALQKKSQRKVALMDFRKALRSGETKFFLSGKSYQWESYFVPLLMHVLECMRDDEAETRVLALAIMKEMFLRIPFKNFEDYIETIICTVLEAHKDRNAEVVRAAEDTTTTLGLTLPPNLCFQVLVPFLDSEHLPTMQASIKMLTNAINKANKEDLTLKIVDDIVPSLIKGYDSTESSMRKAAVFCLVAIHQVIGEEELQKHLSTLSGSKMKLLQLYIKRAQAGSH